MERTNNFVRHHRDSIRFRYHSFDRIVCHGRIPAFWSLGHAVHFLRDRYQAAHVTSRLLKQISGECHDHVMAAAERLRIPLLPAPVTPRVPGTGVAQDQKVRRQQWVQPFYEEFGDKTGTALVLKARERAPVIASYAKLNHHLEYVYRNVDVYYFYQRDPDCGRMWLRLCPYFPFSIMVCLNGHEWLAHRLRQEGIRFRQADNAIVDCDQPQRLQEFADAFAPQLIVAAAERALEHWLPYFTPEQHDNGYRHQLYFCQVEYCDNLIFHRQAALQRLFERLLDANRGFGRPDKLATVFGRPSFRADTRTARTEVKITCLRTPVITSSFKNTSVKQYVKNNVLLRTETSSAQLNDLSLPKSVEQMERVRQTLQSGNDRYLQVQQDILSTFVDRGQLAQLRQPTLSPTGRRIPGLRLDDPRLLALWQALLAFAHLARQGIFRTADLLPEMRRVLDRPDYQLSQLRYDLSKLRGKGLVERVPHSQRYKLTAQGCRLAILYSKLYHRLLAPLTAGLAAPMAGDNVLLNSRQTTLDRLYRRVVEHADRVAAFLGFAA
jgi:hypothetical protein